MKLKDSFVTYNSDGEQIMVSTGADFSGLVRSNKTAAFIVEQLKAETTQEKIADRTAVEDDVKMVLDTLRRIGALDE